MLLPVGQAQTTISPGVSTTVETLESRVRDVEASSELDETTKTSLLELYRKSIFLLQQKQAYEAASKEFARARETAPEQSDALRKQLEKLEGKVPERFSKTLRNMPLADLEQQLLSKKAVQTALMSKLNELENLLETQSQRSIKAREQLSQASAKLPKIIETLQLPAPEGELQRLTEARQLSLDLEAQTLNVEIEMLNQELLSQPMRIELLGVQRDKATVELNSQLQQVEHLETLVVDLRRIEAETASEKAEETERGTIGKHPLVQELAQKNTLLGEELKIMATALEDVTGEENITAEKAKRIAENFRLARQKLEIAGLSEALGQVLLEQRRNLPDSTEFKSAGKRHQRLVIESSLRQIRNQQERGLLRNINDYVNNMLISLPPVEQSRIRDEILELAETRRGLIDKAIAADDTFLQSLGELDFAQRQLIETVTDYDAFLDERLLWIRTGDPPSWQLIASIAHSISILFSAQHWLEVAKALAFPQSFPWVLVSGLAVFIFLMIKKSVALNALQHYGQNVGQLRHDRFSASIKALLLTLILALPWPILFTALGLHLQSINSLGSLDLEAGLYQSAESNGQFVSAIGAAFYEIALYTFYLAAFQMFCSPTGLAVNHFGWNASVTKKLQHQTSRLTAVFLPTVFLLTSAIRNDPAALAGGFSRLLFLIALAALGWFLFRVFAPKNGALRDFYTTNPNNLLSWFRYLWLFLGLTLPLILAALAIVGYVYTAAQLGALLIDTMWLIVAIILIHQLVVRWVLLTERRLAFKAMIEKHRAQRAAREASADGETVDSDSMSLQLEQTEVDYGALSEDTKKLINTSLTVFAALGLWAIWSDVLPAFRILDEISLWSYSTKVEGGEKLVPVTLSNVILGILIIIIGVAAARRLPALIEIVLLTRLNITAGSRYAITTLTQYTIVAIGIVLVFNILGGSWSEIQWLIAALGVGIGFGLQEIVANFISGLILLFERPIRIGDVVTVGNTDGVVTRIRIRSTTIRDRDEKELIVPNKEFITGRLLNWTLSDQITRIVIPVGIAYGSDIPLALKLVQASAQQHERVLDEPKPLVTLESFGDNALVIMLRCFIGSMEFRVHTISELNQAIYKKFEEAGIVIAYPQRDIHLDTTNPLDIRIHHTSNGRDNGILT